jgi:hypothetical protein
LDLFLNTYNFLDMTPLGRQEEDDRLQAWIRHHDKYAEGQHGVGMLTDFERADGISRLTQNAAEFEASLGRD